MAFLKRNVISDMRTNVEIANPGREQRSLCLPEREIERAKRWTGPRELRLRR
jgi:hypothetical protein